METRFGGKSRDEKEQDEEQEQKSPESCEQAINLPGSLQHCNFTGCNNCNKQAGQTCFVIVITNM